MSLIDRFRKSKTVEKATDSDWSYFFPSLKYPGSPYYGEQNLLSDWGKVDKPYEVNPTVYSAIDRIGSALAATPFEIKDKYSDEVQGEDNALVRLFNYPSVNWDSNMLWDAIERNLQLFGKAYIVLEQFKGKLPLVMWVANSEYMKPGDMNQKTGQFTYYLYGPDNNSYKFPKEHVIFIRYWHPNNPWDGFAPLTAARLSVLQQWYADQYNTRFFKDGALISGIWKPQGPRPLSPQVEKELNDRLKQTTNQGIANAHKAPIVQGVDWQPVGVLQKDMQFIEQKRMTKEEILEVFKVPKSILGLADTTYNNMASAQKGLYVDKIIPDAKRIENALLVQFFNQFAPQYYLSFNFDAVPYLQEDIKLKADTALIFYNMGFSIEQINDRLGLGFEFDDVEPVDEDEIVRSYIQKKAIEKTKMLTRDIGAMKADQDKAAKTMVESEKIIENRLKSFWKSQFSAVIAAIKEEKAEKSVEDLVTKIAKLIDQLNWKDTLGASISDDIGKIHLMGIRKAYQSMGLRTPKIPEVVQSWVNNRLYKLSDSGLEMQKVITESIGSSKTIDELVETLKNRFNVAENRAKNIARTESTAGYNSGRLVGMKKLGVQKKQWSHSHDDKVRESHRIDQIVNIDEPFTLKSGVKVQWPGDGPPEEACQCRCSVIPVIVEE